MMFDRREYRKKVKDFHERILEDLAIRGFGDEINRTFCKGIEQETIVLDGTIVGWIVKVHLNRDSEPVTYKLAYHENAELICDSTQFILGDV